MAQKDTSKTPRLIALFITGLVLALFIFSNKGDSDAEELETQTLTRSLRDGDTSKRSLSFRPEVSSPEVTSSGRRQQVVIVTSGRTGSTFTASIITAHPQVFYFYEPLFGLQELYMRRDGKNYGELFMAWANRAKESQSLMKEWLQCEPKNFSVFDNAFQRKRPDTNQLFDCLDQVKDDYWGPLTCYVQFKDSCTSRRVTLIKTIRFRLEWAESVMRDLPDMKILYLVRDPRAVLYSQSQHLQSQHFDWQKEIHKVAPKYCTELQANIDCFQRISSMFPHRVKALRYEDGAINPQAYARDIYEFLGLEYTDKIQQYVTSLTSPAKKGPSKDAVFGVHRDNPVEAMQKWRYSAGYDSVAVIDSACLRSNQLLGYRRVASLQDLVSNQSLVLAPTLDTLN